MRRPCHRIERAAFAASPKILCELLQHRENPPLIGQRCADLAPGSADRSHRVACPGRGASSPVRPNLTFQYTQDRSSRVTLVPSISALSSGDGASVSLSEIESIIRSSAVTIPNQRHHVWREPSE